MKVSSNKGFSLVELMIVVGIIGILATLAVPRFRSFQAKARQAEVKTTLSHMFTLQEVYHQENNTYIATGLVGREAAGTGICDFSPATGATNVATLGFNISPCSTAVGGLPRYGYVTLTASATNFQAFGDSADATHQNIYPGCTSATDNWGIDEGRTLKSLAVSQTWDATTNPDIISKCN